MAGAPLKTALLQEFFDLADERYQIMLRKNGGEPRPWTDLPLFQDWRIVNLFREDDPTTVWIKENVREPLRNDKRVFLAIAICRQFGSLDTMKLLHDEGLLFSWSSEQARRVLADVFTVCGPYMVSSSADMDKLGGICVNIDNIESWLENGKAHTATTLRRCFDCFLEVERIGPFMAYEIIQDLMHTDFLNEADDLHTFCEINGMASDGVYYLVEDTVHVEYFRKKSFHKSLSNELIRLSRIFLPEHPQWSFSEVRRALVFFKWEKTGTHPSTKYKDCSKWK